MDCCCRIRPCVCSRLRHLSFQLARLLQLSDLVADLSPKPTEKAGDLVHGVAEPDAVGEGQTGPFRTTACRYSLRTVPGSSHSLGMVCRDPPEHDADHGEANEG